VAQELAAHGYKNVHPLFGGLEAWEKAGLPLEHKQEGE
jgi:rhodanese-related sulfurtransferase